ncbi:MAG: hypothetical protein ACREHC_00630 [Candidatus Levyibacteriota bacterium]
MADQRRQDNLDPTTRSQTGSSSGRSQNSGDKGGEARENGLNQTDQSFGGQDSSRSDDPDEM